MAHFLKNFVSICASECFIDQNFNTDFGCALMRTVLKSGFINLRISLLLDQ